jgi:hypothetical protein
MTGSSLAPIIVPIVAVLAMAVWLGLVFYAAAHPRWKRYDVLPGPAAGAPGTPARPAERGLAVTTGRGSGAARDAPAYSGQARPPAAQPRRAA